MMLRLYLPRTRSCRSTTVPEFTAHDHSHLGPVQGRAHRRRPAHHPGLAAPQHDHGAGGVQTHDLHKQLDQHGIVLFPLALHDDDHRFGRRQIDLPVDAGRGQGIETVGYGTRCPRRARWSP